MERDGGGSPAQCAGRREHLHPPAEPQRLTCIPPTCGTTGRSHRPTPPGTGMARTGPGAPLARRNIRLDSFLQRNTERTVYERIRAYEPCVVVSEAVNKVYMHVVLSDERVYLAEYPPRTLTAACSFRRVRDIELVSARRKLIDRYIHRWIYKMSRIVEKASLHFQLSKIKFSHFVLLYD